MDHFDPKPVYDQLGHAVDYWALSLGFLLLLYATRCKCKEHTKKSY